MQQCRAAPTRHQRQQRHGAIVEVALLGLQGWKAGDEGQGDCEVRGSRSGRRHIEGRGTSFAALGTGTRRTTVGGRQLRESSTGRHAWQADDPAHAAAEHRRRRQRRERERTMRKKPLVIGSSSGSAAVTARSRAVWGRARARFSRPGKLHGARRTRACCC
jgi:hypothetical protein